MFFYWPYLLIISAALAGTALAAYIYRKKRTHKVLVCPLKADCESVVHSEYATFFGIPVELLGMAYYSLIAVSYAVIAAAPAVAASPLVFGLLAITSAAFLFSLYLTFIQAFAIKQWCSWCLLSAGLCTLIFILVASNSALGLLPLLAHNRPILVAIHLLGLAIGLGGATTTDVLFFRFLRDWRISHHEADVMRVLSQIIWFALSILVMSGLGLYLPQAAALHQSAKFLVKVIVVGVIILNGAFLNLVISPRLVTLFFGHDNMADGISLRRLRRLAFALGGISATSWYSAFILGLLPASPLPFWGLLAVYILLLGAAVTAGQLLERRMARRAVLPSDVLY